MAINISLTNLGNLQNETTAVNAINANNAAITTALLDAVALDGTQPNQMENNLDMNNFQILNLPNPATADSPARLQDLATLNGGGTVSSLPAGGTTGQVLAKTSNTNYQTQWNNSVTSVGLALPTDFTITGSPVTTTGTLTGAWATAPTGSGGVVRQNSPTINTPNLGTPSALTLTNATGLPISTGVTGLGSNVSSALQNTLNAGSGLVSFNGILGTVQAGSILTSATGLPLTTGVTGVLPIANGGTNSSTGAIVTVKRSIFVGSSTYTPSTGMLYCIVECVGGGGGGGGCANTAAGVYASGGGGGGGGYSKITLSAATVGGSQVVTIGGAGTAGAAGNNAGGGGGDTSLGSLCVAKGGSGGAGSTGGALTTGGAGGAAASGTGDMKMSGQAGEGGAANGGSVFIPSGGGGNSGFGFGQGAPGLVVGTATTGLAGATYGGAGGGGASFAATGTAAGGAGAAGIIYIQEFCNQ